MPSGPTLVDAAGPTYLGERDAIVLSFNDTGTVMRQDSLPTQQVSLAGEPFVPSAYVVGNLPAGLTSPGKDAPRGAKRRTGFRSIPLLSEANARNGILSTVDSPAPIGGADPIPRAVSFSGTTC